MVGMCFARKLFPSILKQHFPIVLQTEGNLLFDESSIIRYNFPIPSVLGEQVFGFLHHHVEHTFTPSTSSINQSIYQFEIKIIASCKQHTWKSIATIYLFNLLLHGPH